MIRLESRLCLRFRPEKNFLENFLEVSSLLSQTSLVCLIRSQSRTAELTQQLRPLVEELKSLGCTREQLLALWEGGDEV